MYRFQRFIALDRLKHKLNYSLGLCSQAASLYNDTLSVFYSRGYYHIYHGETKYSTKCIEDVIERISDESD